ncbi:hypothetical protein COU54_04075 [Candidatus Pacearchaeota archaeon CG10_big_fil_rev_8_21_14_0_10_31_24]|nr:MAG: hypothetical protein COU54_04075 [Candidatus Pacearchaeota archaeon CG10_big_fil_rev_8_21_14_0_10_31_24]
MTKPSLEILIGDDLLADPIISGSVKRCLEPLKERITFYTVALTYASMPREVINESQKDIYDVIVTDLDYGTTGKIGTEGFDILEYLSKMNLTKKPLVILCTSQVNQELEIRKRLDERKMHAIIGPDSNNKFSALKEYLIKTYSEKQVMRI